MRANVGGFAKVARSRICPRSQVSHVNQDPVGYAVVVVAAVIVGIRGERSGERIDPGARTDAILVAIKA